MWPTTCSLPGSGVGCCGPRAQVLIVHSGQASPLPLSPASAPEKEKRDSQLIIDSLRDTLDERNATVEFLQRAVDKAEMLCCALKVGPQPPWAQVGGGIQPSSWAPHSGLVFCVCLGQYHGLYSCKMEGNSIFPRPPTQPMRKRSYCPHLWMLY